MVERPTILRRRFLKLTARALGASLISACFGENSNSAQIEAERRQRINAYLRLEPFQSLPRDSTLMDGIWVRPTAQITISDSDELEVAVKAYTPMDKLPVKYVVFTATYPRAKSSDPRNPSTWDIFDVVDHSNENGNWALRVNLKSLGLKAGDKISFSFDLVNVANQRKYAPREFHDIYYKKGLSSS